MGLQGIEELSKPLKKSPVVFAPMIKGKQPTTFGGYISIAGVEEELRQADLLGLQQALEEHLQSGNEELQIELGVVLDLSGQKEEAQKVLTVAEQQLPENALAPYALARCLMKKDPSAAKKAIKQEGRWSVIVSHLREAIQLDSDNIPAHYHLGNAIRKLVEEESFVDAVEVYTKYLEQEAPLGHQEEVQNFINEQDTDKQREAAFATGETAFNAGEYQNSIAAFLDAAALGKKEALYYLGKAYENTHDYLKAVDAYRKAMQEDKKAEGAYFAFGRTILKLFTGNHLLQEGLTALTHSEQGESYKQGDIDRLLSSGLEISNLLRASMNSSWEHELLRSKKRWYANCGAFHGLVTKINEEEDGTGKHTVVNVYKKEGRELLGEAHVKNVGIFNCQLELTGKLKEQLEKTKANSSADNNFPSSEYIVEFFQLNAQPFYVDIKGHNSAVALLSNQWSKKVNERDTDLKKDNIMIALSKEEKQQANTRIVINEEGYQIWDAEKDRPWVDRPLTPSQDLDEIRITEVIKRNLREIARWFRLLKLETETAQIENDYRLELFTMDFEQWEATGNIDVWNVAGFFETAQKHDGFEVRLLVPSTSFITSNNAVDMGIEVSGDTILFAMRLQSFKDNLYYYLYDFKSDAAIDFILDRSLAKKTGEKGVALIAPVPVFLEDNELETTLRLKLLVTEKPLQNKELLSQDGMTPSRALAERPDFTLTGCGWYLQTIELTIVRQQ